MGVFESAWEIAKEWGSGYRVHMFEPTYTGASEYPASIIERGKKLYASGEKSPLSLQHTFDSLRGSGSGVTGAYYHGGTFDPFFDSNILQRFLEVKEHNENRKFMPGGNAISPINADEFFAASKELLSREPLRNVDAKNLARAKVYPLTTYSGEPIKEPRLIYPYGEYDPENDYPGRTFGPFSIAGRMTTKRPPGDSLSRMIRESPYVVDIMGERLKRPDVGPNPRRGSKAQQLLREWYADDDWWANPEVMATLYDDATELDLSPMNILLDSMGFDRLVPYENHQRYGIGHREIHRGSVAMPPAEEGWRETWHPGGEEGYRTLDEDDIESFKEAIATQLYPALHHSALKYHPILKPGGFFRDLLDSYEPKARFLYRKLFDEDMSKKIFPDKWEGN